MINQPMTKETEAKLLESIELGIEYVSKSVDKARDLIKNAKLLTTLMTENKLSIEDNIFNKFEKILEYRMLIGFIYLDLSSALRAHLKSKFTYEKLFSLRQIIIIINEGYKQIYNFVNQNEKGNLVTKHRNKSFWINDIKPIINESLPELQNEYDLLTKKLEDYLEQNFSTIKYQRDLFIHYDKDICKVYDMIGELDVERIMKKLTPFLEIINEMYHFTEKMTLFSEKNDRLKAVEIQNKLETLIVILNDPKTIESAESSDKLKELINEIKTDFQNKMKSRRT